MTPCRAAVAATALLIAPLCASAQLATVQFTGIVDSVQAGTPYGGLGSTITGTFVFDYSPTTYTSGTFPVMGPGYRYYEYFGSSYGFSGSFAQWSGPSVVAAVEVYDNETSGWPQPYTGDIVWLATKRLNVNYGLELMGPDSSFSGNAIPAPQTLASFWTSAQFFIKDNNRPSSALTTLTASITNVTVTVVPEPTTWAMFASGLLALVARRRRLDRANG